MKYFINKASLTVKVLKVVKKGTKYYMSVILLGSNRSSARGLVIIGELSLEGLEPKVGDTLNVYGYLKTTVTQFDNVEYNTVIEANKIEVNEDTKILNTVEIVCDYVSRKNEKYLPDSKRLCEIVVTFQSENLRNSKCDIVVWNKAIDMIKLLKMGDTIHLVSYIYEETRETSNIGYRLSPYKITSI